MRSTRASRAAAAQRTAADGGVPAAAAASPPPSKSDAVGTSDAPTTAVPVGTAAAAAASASPASPASPAPSPSSPTPTASPPPVESTSNGSAAAATNSSAPPPAADADAVVGAAGTFGAETKYERLHHLLDQTSLFAKFLSERMPSRYAAASKQAAVSSTGPKASQLAERAAALRQLIPDAALELQPFQVQGIDWLISLYENGLNGILADEMGLGKTIQVILFLAHLRRHRVFGPFLVVAPLGTLPSWKSELARWTPSTPVLLYHGTKQERASMRTQFAGASNPDASFPVVVTNYETAMNDATHLKRVHWKMLVVDEGQRLKNLECALLQKLKSFNSENRLLLSGTPLQNNLLELWSLLHFLLPDIFSSLQQFQSWFDFDERSLEQQEGQQYVINAERDNMLVTKLHTILRPFVLRRVKADVLKQLAQKKEYIVYTPLTQLQRLYYQSILDGELHSLSSRHSMNNVLMQLRKVCQHPYLLISDQEELERRVDMEAQAALHEQSLAAASQQVLQLLNAKPTGSSGAVADDQDTDPEASDTEWETVPQRNKRRKKDAATAAAAAAASAASERQARARNSSSSKSALASFPPERLASVCGKLRFLDQLFPALQERKSRVLVFSQMTRVMDVLEDYLALRGIDKYCRIDGMTKSEDRQKAIDTFNSDPSYFCFLLSTRAGGLGINLASADTVVLFDSDWNPTVDAQAADRAHRLTQQRTVLVFRLLSPGTVEMAMHARATSKKTLEQIVLTKGKFHAQGAGASAGAGAAAQSVAQRNDTERTGDGEDGGGHAVPDWRRQSSIVHELVELFSGGARARLPVQMSFADASPAAAAQHAQAAAASAAEAAAAATSPPPRPQRNNSLKRKASSRSSGADAAAASAVASSSAPVAAAPPVFDPTLLSRLLERDREAPPDVLPATPFDSGFELVRAAEKKDIMDLLADRDIPTAADVQMPHSSPT